MLGINIEFARSLLSLRQPISQFQQLNSISLPRFEIIRVENEEFEEIELLHKLAIARTKNGEVLETQQGSDSQRRFASPRRFATRL